MNTELSNAVINAQTMTLKQITDLLEVRHDNAMIVVAKMTESPEFGSSPRIKELKSNGSGTFETYQLDKRQSIAVAAKLNTPLLMRVIDCWQELENKPLTIVDYARALVIAHDENEKLLLENQGLKNEIVEIKDDGKMMATLYEINLANKDEDSNDNQWAVSRALKKLRGR